MPSSATPARRMPTRLPQYLAALYGLMIVYASLEPSSGWMAPLDDAPFFLFEPWPSHITKFDIAINMLAYAPFGFLLALTFDPSLELARDLAGTLLQAAQSAFNVVGVGLFLALLLRQRRDLGVAVLLLIGTALALKGIAGAVLLKSAAWESWLKPGV